jgi:hypothetical protein
MSEVTGLTVRMINMRMLELWGKEDLLVGSPSCRKTTDILNQNLPESESTLRSEAKFE